jgi:hypothetical protein
MSKDSIQGPLSALRNAGTVSGLCLIRGTEVLINMLPFSDHRVEETASVIDDVFYYFESSHREVDQFAFGFDGANMVVVTEGDFRLLVIHMLAEEVDFIAKAARAFLIDFRLGLFAEELDARNASSGQPAPETGMSQPAADSQPEPAVVEAPVTPKIRRLTPLSKDEDAGNESGREKAADPAMPEPEAKPVQKTTRIRRMDPAQPAAAASLPPSLDPVAPLPPEGTGPVSEPEPAPPAAIPPPTTISWSAQMESPVPPPAEPAAAPEPSKRPKPTTIRTHRASTPEEPESEVPAARHRAHLAPNQPESTLPPRRMPRR